MPEPTLVYKTSVGLMCTPFAVNKYYSSHWNFWSTFYVINEPLSTRAIPVPKSHSFYILLKLNFYFQTICIKQLFVEIVLVSHHGTRAFDSDVHMDIFFKLFAKIRGALAIVCTAKLCIVATTDSRKYFKMLHGRAVSRVTSVDLAFKGSFKLSGSDFSLLLSPLLPVQREI